MIVVTNSLLYNTTTAVTEAMPSSSGFLVNAKLILYTNAIGLARNTTVDQLEQPTYTGYEPQTITWTSGQSENDGSYSLVGNLIKFQMDDEDVPTTAVGYGITNSSGTDLFLAEEFDEEQLLVTVDDAVSLVPKVCIGIPDTDFGSAVLVS